MNNNEWECPICPPGRTFDKEFKLRAHLRMKHLLDRGEQVKILRAIDEDSVVNQFTTEEEQRPPEPVPATIEQSSTSAHIPSPPVALPFDISQLSPEYLVMAKNLLGIDRLEQAMIQVAERIDHQQSNMPTLPVLADTAPAQGNPGMNFLADVIKSILNRPQSPPNMQEIVQQQIQQSIGMFTEFARAFQAMQSVFNPSSNPGQSGGTVLPPSQTSIWFDRGWQARDLAARGLNPTREREVHPELPEVLPEPPEEGS